MRLSKANTPSSRDSSAMTSSQRCSHWPRNFRSERGQRFLRRAASGLNQVDEIVKSQHAIEPGQFSNDLFAALLPLAEKLQIGTRPTILETSGLRTEPGR